MTDRNETEESAPELAVERRFHKRVRVRYEAVVDVMGVCMSLRVRGVNRHKKGAMVASSRPLKPGSIVFFHDQTHRSMGFARVRHCTPNSPSEFLIGLEFDSPLMLTEPGAWHIQRIAQD